ncbi:MAG: TetR/AcrR family transcriptional regulator [Clostridiaceae bacterium]|nr:TetR/AcrR family transcriptional regulator [Clostridiaceae bacterium]
MSVNNNFYNNKDDIYQNHSDVKEKIITTTISLIKTSDGLVDNITIREIAQKADVAVGLINYHFGSKNKLIEICVQRIISHVMKTFSDVDKSEVDKSKIEQNQEHQKNSDQLKFADQNDNLDQKNNSNQMEYSQQMEHSQQITKSDQINNSDMASFTASVFTFLINNPEISKISMLADLSQPSTESNSSVSYKAIYKAISDNDNNDQDIKKIKAFMLLASIQSAFLNCSIIDQLLGFNMNDTNDYYRFFQLITEILKI